MAKAFPLVLIILDGWGISDRREDNAIALARPLYYESLIKEYKGRAGRCPRCFNWNTFIATPILRKESSGKTMTRLRP